MATIHLDPGSTYGEPASAMRRPLVSAIRWGAILAGVAVGVSAQLALTLLGIASGWSATRMSEGQTPGTGPLLWAGFSMLIAAFAGGYVAGRMTGLKRKADGVLHGVVSWAVTTLLFASLATSAGGALLSGIFTAMNPAGMAASSGAAGGQADGLAAMLKSRTGGNLGPEALRTLQQTIQEGRRDEAIGFLANASGMDRDHASIIVDQALILAGAPERSAAQTRAAADRAAGAVAWAVFLAVALSLALGIAGGALGAAGARRTTWTSTMPEAQAPLSTGNSVSGKPA